MKRELYPHQMKALEMLRSSIGQGRRRPILQAPTGLGKTMLAAALVDGARSKGKRVLFTVPALSLVDQTVKAFFDEGIYEIGVIQSNHIMTDWSRPVQIASVQTLQRRDLPEADAVVVDEAHRWHTFYEKWFTDPAWLRKPIIGLSATPWTKGLGRWYDDLIIAATTAELIEAGYLSPFRVFAPSHPDLTGVRTVAGDYHEGDLGEAMNKGPLVADVVETWLA
jgi:superfamily II DNA or RNA helicase